MFHPHLRIRICSILTQAAERAHEAIVATRRRVNREEHATAVIRLCADLALNSRIVEQISSPASTDTASTINPILVDVLAKCELRPSPLLHADRCRLSCEDTMQASKLKTEGELGVRGDGELDLVQLSHVVPDLRNVLWTLIGGLRCEGQELPNDTRQAVNTMDDDLELLPVLRVVFRDLRSVQEDRW